MARVLTKIKKLRLRSLVQVLTFHVDELDKLVFINTDSNNETTADVNTKSNVEISSQNLETISKLNDHHLNDHQSL